MKVFTALAVMLAVAVAGTSDADAHSRKKRGYEKQSHYSAKRVKPQVRGYLSRGGGYAYGYEYDPFLRRNGGGYGNYPFFDDRNFWERVQSGPFSTRPGVSAF
jgi:hypothetical protein